MKISVNSQNIIAKDRLNALGININYLRDADANRAGAPLAKALLDMGVKRLRYPGGEKSNRHFFAKPPYEKCETYALGYYADCMKDAAVMDFDMFMALVKETGTQPHVNVGYHLEEKTGVSLAEYIEHAAGWVRYSNVIKGYGVKYWEIGNENWLEKSAPAETALIVKEYSLAMKAVDPSIKICASGHTPEWWDEFLPAAAPYIDALSVSQYSCTGWKSYDFYLGDDTSLTSTADKAIEAIDRLVPERKDSLEVLVSELNSADWSEDGWPGHNSLGHSIVTMDIFGQLLANSRISYGLLWNTRWMKQEDQHDQIWYGLDEKNEPLPAGMAVKLWCRHMRGDFVEVSCEGGLRVFACRDAEGLTAFVLNKYPHAAERDIEIDGKAATIKSAWRYTGTSPDDRFPVYGECSGDITVFPPFSVTIIDMQV